MKMHFFYCSQICKEEYFSSGYGDILSKKRYKFKKGKNNLMYGKPCPTRYTVEGIIKKYNIFPKIEEMRYNPNKPGEKEIQVHCKNHECENSKEKGGWFTPSGREIAERLRCVEFLDKDGSCFYCSQHCKDTCILYGTRSDPYKDNNLPYTPGEIQVYNKTVLDRENGLCEYCGEPAEHVHHIYPKKLEPFFALDPDYGVACCKKHHYEYGHQGECSTGNLAKIVCSVESQKFLNQKLENI
jgi:hypothetical protein